MLNSTKVEGNGIIHG